MNTLIKLYVCEMEEFGDPWIVKEFIEKNSLTPISQISNESINQSGISVSTTDCCKAQEVIGF